VLQSQLRGGVQHVQPRPAVHADGQQHITDVTFFIPGSNGLTPATVGGFGAVFTDVDLPTSTQLEFFGLSNQPLFSALVPAGTVPDGSLSFLGALGNAGERIGRARITSGTTAPGPNDTATSDIVLMDDFLYAEPQSVPEPATIGLLAIGLTVLAISRKRAT
jgi:PEP-CTERM motif